MNDCAKAKWNKPAGAAFSAVFILCILLVFGAVQSETAFSEPKNIEGAKPDNCSACHGGQKVLPATHVQTKGMTYARCMDCHSKIADIKKTGGILRGKMTLSHAHQLSGIGCNECHGKERPAVSPDGQKCLECHADYKTNFARADKSVPNPHDSHMGDLDCLLCHKAHAKSVNFCAQCHTWKYKTP